MGVRTRIWLRECDTELVVVLAAVVYRAHIAKAEEEDDAENVEKEHLRVDTFARRPWLSFEIELEEVQRGVFTDCTYASADFERTLELGLEGLWERGEAHEAGACDGKQGERRRDVVIPDEFATGGEAGVWRGDGEDGVVLVRVEHGGRRREGVAHRRRRRGRCRAAWMPLISRWCFDVNPLLHWPSVGLLGHVGTSPCNPSCFT